MSDVLVTGASGFVGRWLCRDLSARGHMPRGAVRSGSRGLECELVEVGDVCSDTDWSDALRDVDAVVHLAAHVHVPGDGDDARFFEVNTEGTLRLAEAAAESGVRRFVFASTVAVHGEDTGSPVGARSPTRPASAYARSKLAAERRLSALARSSGLEVVIVRAPLIYGPDAPGNFRRLLWLVRRGLPLPLGLVRNRRSFVFVGNLTDLICRVLQAPEASGRTFVVSDGEPMSTPELLRRVAAADGRRALLLPVPPMLLRLGGVVLGRGSDVKKLTSSFEVDGDHTRRALSWTPPFGVDEALAITVGRGAARHAS